MRIIENADKEFVNELRKRIRENNGYCVCALVKNSETKCMCKEFRESTELGECHCGLYERVDD